MLPSSNDTLLDIIGVSSVIVGTEEGFVEIDEHEDFIDINTYRKINFNRLSRKRND